MHQSMTAKKATEMRCSLRWMITRDLHEVLAIEEASFPYPWSREDFLRSLLRQNCIGIVAEHNGHVIGYAVYELHKRYIDINNLAVHCKFQRHGVGRELIAKLKSKLSRQNRRRILTSVRESNLDAQLFFKACGFRAACTYEQFYDDNEETAYQFIFCLQTGSV